MPSKLVTSIQNAFDQADEDIAPETVESEVAELRGMKVTNEWDIANGIANKHAADKDAVMAAYQSDEDEADATDDDSPATDDPTISLADFSHNVDEWVDIEARITGIETDNQDELEGFDTVKQYNSADAPALALSGTIADDTAKERFLVWGKSYVKTDGLIPEDLEVGDYVTIENATVDEGYSGGYELQINGNSSIVPLEDPDFEAELNTGQRQFTGNIVGIGSNSGLIQRCPEDKCTYTVTNDSCPEHGQVDGEDDLRLKLKVDNGDECINAATDMAQTEAITGIGMTKAKEIAKEALDRDAVTEAMENVILHRTVELKGSWTGESAFFIEDISMPEEFRPNLNDALIEARELQSSA